MKVLLIHNFYQQAGGEDRVFQQEGDLLEERGNEVTRFSIHNNQIANLNKLRLVAATLWNGHVASQIRTVIKRVKPNIIHCHNIFPLISPAVYYVAKSLSIPVVQTLHNYRLLCPSAVLYRDGHTCEECMGTVTFWPSVVHGCYQGSHAASAVTAAMLTLHRFLSTWDSKVDVYIALTEFARRKFIEGGLPQNKIVVKPNFLHPTPVCGEGQGGYALFVGRLVPEKGIEVLLAAWRHLSSRLPLKIVGEGPLASTVSKYTQSTAGVEWLGSQNAEQVSILMKDAQILILPSTWYEGFPMIVAEAYAAGLPIIASSLGSLSPLVVHGHTGRQFQPGDPHDLCTQVEWVLAHPEDLLRMRREAREEFHLKYTAERNYELLMKIYEEAGIRNLR
jgi:glycosyltransferase involved in cell wall biosynthesis